MLAPKYFPKENWPLPKGIKIIAELESLPPIFLLSNGGRIIGVLKDKKNKSKKKKSKKNKSKKNKSKRNK